VPVAGGRERCRNETTRRGVTMSRKTLPDGPAGDVIRAEIAARGGAISFARFMELALYAPGVGYYAQADRAIGRGGDFYTSVSVGPVFGFLLAWRFAGWCGELRRLELVEAAAHDGQLAHDVLSALREFHPAAFGRVRYRIVEPLPVRREVQARRLCGWGDLVSWVGEIGESGTPVEGVIFANELLDAFPVRRFGWDAGARTWFEWGVTATESGSLAWCRLPAGEGLGIAVPAALAAVLPDGCVVESSPAAETWWRAAARVLAPGAGWLVAFDYGFDREFPIRPEQPGGSLRAYWRHRREADLLGRPGAQDLTANVDFARIARGGEEEGLATWVLQPQGRWLGAIAAEVFAAGGAAAEWLQRQVRGLQTLVHPGHLGQAFTALVQRRGGSRDERR
jgi:SAM-dependent MidA family methyltransferase